MSLKKTKSIMKYMRRQKFNAFDIAHPELAGRAEAKRSTMIISPGVESVFGDFDDINYEVAAEIYKRYTWLRRGIMVKFLNIAPLPVEVLKNGKIVKNHSLNTLFKTINPNMDSIEFWAKWIIDIDLAGDSYSEIRHEKFNPNTTKFNHLDDLELWRRRPDQVEIKITGDDKYPTVAGYNLNFLNHNHNNEIPDIPPELMIHMRNPNPTNDFLGVGLVRTLFDAINSDTTVQKWMLQMFKRGARPDFIIFAEAGILPTEKKAIEDQLVREHSGISNSFKPIIFEEGAQNIEILSFKPNELEWLKLRELSPKEVSALLGVPPELMGIGKSTFENFSMAMESFWNLTLLPLIQWRDQALTTHFTELLPLLKKGETIQTDTSSVKWLQTNLTAAIEQGTKLFSMGVPLNVINERLNLGLPEDIKGGNIGYVPSNLIPVGTPVITNAPPNIKRISKIWRKQIEGTFDNLEDAPEEVIDFQTELNSLVEQAIDGEITKTEFENKLTKLAEESALACFVLTSSIIPIDFSEEMEKMFNEEVDKMLFSIPLLAADIYNGRFDNDLNLPARLSKWGTNMNQLCNLGTTFLLENPLRIWIIDSSKDNCPTCLRLNRQIHSVKDWRESGFWPQCRRTECKGFNCGCRWGKHEGPEIGEF